LPPLSLHDALPISRYRTPPWWDHREWPVDHHAASTGSETVPGGETSTAARISISPNVTSSASEIAPRSSLDASLRPRSISERYPGLTRAASATSRRVRPVSPRSPRSTVPRVSRSRGRCSGGGSVVVWMFGITGYNASPTGFVPGAAAEPQEDLLERRGAGRIADLLPIARERHRDGPRSGPGHPHTDVHGADRVALLLGRARHAGEADPHGRATPPGRPVRERPGGLPRDRTVPGQDRPGHPRQRRLQVGRVDDQTAAEHVARSRYPRHRRGQ